MRPKTFERTIRVRVPDQLGQALDRLAARESAATTSDIARRAFLRLVQEETTSDAITRAAEPGRAA